MPNSLKAKLKKLKHQGLLTDEELQRIIVIPKNTTNGDVIKAMFPDYRIEIEKNCVRLLNDRIFLTFPLDWWNAPYKAESEDKE